MAEVKRERAVIWCAVSSEAQAADGKESLPSQEAECRAWCDRAGLAVIEVLHVPGFSRFYDNFDDCARDMADQGIYAFNRLRQLWENHTFEVLVARDAERLSRTTAMLGQIYGRVIKSGARIYLLQGGEINKHNRLAMGMIGGFKAESHIEFLVDAHERAMNTRARSGLPTSPVTLMSHKLIRDPHTGRAVRIIVDETRRQLWTDLATIILDGIPWREVENALFRRFGHGTPAGEPFQSGQFYKVLHSPTFWGHSARHHTQQRRNGEWIFEPGHAIPDGVTIHYNTHEPVWKPDDPLATRMLAELRRRFGLRGHASSKRTKRFSGLLLCAECGFYLRYYHNSQGFEGYCCCTRYRQSVTRGPCSQRGFITVKKIGTWLDARIKQAVDNEDAGLFMLDTHDSTGAQLASLRRSLASTETLLGQLIVDQAQADPVLRQVYTSQIETGTARLKALRGAIQTLESHTSQQRIAEGQAQALAEITALSVDTFWKQDDLYVNQILLRLLGNRRLVVQDKEIVATADAPIRRSRPRSIPSSSS